MSSSETSSPLVAKDGEIPENVGDDVVDHPNGEQEEPLEQNVSEDEAASAENPLSSDAAQIIPSLQNLLLNNDIQRVGFEHSPPLIPELPNDLAVEIVARVPRIHYPALSLVSKNFRNLIASSLLYKWRSRLGITQQRLYAILSFNKTYQSVYILQKNLNDGNNRLVRVLTLPETFSDEICAPVGSKVYMFSHRSVFSFDRVSHTLHYLGEIPLKMIYKTVNVIGKKVFLIGDGYYDHTWHTGWHKVVMVFDTETRLWEHRSVEKKMSVGKSYRWHDSAVMGEQIYLKACKRAKKRATSFVYEPEERKWEEMEEVLKSVNWQDTCVVDGVLYYNDRWTRALRAFDPKLGCWSVVQGLGKFLFTRSIPSISRRRTGAVNSGANKLVLFFCENLKIFCAEICLEKRQGGEIWGKLEWYHEVYNGFDDLVEFVSVTV